MDFLNEVELEHLNEEQREVAEIIGLDNYIELVRLLGGSYVYVPMSNTLVKEARNRAIRSEFDGDYKLLARKYQLTTTQIRNILEK